MKRETRDEAIKRADAATREAHRNWGALCRALATEQRKTFHAEGRDSVVVLYPPRPGSHEGAYVVVVVDRESGNITIVPHEGMQDAIGFHFRCGTTRDHAIANALDTARRWVTSHMLDETVE